MKPESPVLRAIERVRITELIAGLQNRIGVKVSREDLAEKIIPPDDLGRQRGGVRKGLSTSRKLMIIWEWDKGKATTSFKPRHLIRLADYFGVTDVRELVQYTPETPTDGTQQPDPAQGSNA